MFQGKTCSYFGLFTSDPKRCTGCDEEKPLEAFKKTKSGKGGYDNLCLSCRRAYRRARYHDTSTETARGDLSRLLRSRYGITLQLYEQLFEQQQGLCAACGKPEPRVHYGKTMRLAVDHCHATGAIRGLLCSDCNRTLGLLNEDPERVEGLLRYLRKHRPDSTRL